MVYMYRNEITGVKRHFQKKAKSSAVLYIWRLNLLVKETGVPERKRRPTASY